MTAGVEIPLFPLTTVLFPGGPLPLRIFEARYVDLVGRCMRDGSGFGVVQILEGQEAGGSATTCDIGTYARIVDFSQEAGGLLGIRAVGERRFRILACRRERDGLNVAQVEWLPEERAAALPDEFAELGPLLESALGELAELYLGMERHPQDAAWVSARLAEILPVPMHHKQHCLELDDPVERIRYLRPMFEIAR
ncbi:MAG: LON peptidase substrate-binding domain-containing protein [Steroidobacteraceae bacterium]|nr:LON peptidase substrate-binding domain-containing protein [Steroidobacteraceae bacterium]